MSAEASRIRDYLAHIGQAIERIHRYTDDMDEVAFSRSDLTQDAVICNFEIIGEACRDIGRPTRLSRHSIPTCRSRRLTRCETLSRTDISKSI